MDAYPELQITFTSKCKSLISVHSIHTSRAAWDTPERRRQFLDEFAYLRDRDPLDPNTWANVSKQDIHGAGVCSTMYVLVPIVIFR